MLSKLYFNDASFLICNDADAFFSNISYILSSSHINKINYLFVFVLKESQLVFPIIIYIFNFFYNFVLEK